MTTTIDPAGTPSVVYNRDGATIVEVNGSGTTQMAAAPIPRYSVLTIVRGIPTADPTDEVAFALPTDGEIGDGVEFNNASYASARIFAGSGQSITSVSTYVQVDAGKGASFRMLSSTEWGVV